MMLQVGYIAGRNTAGHGYLTVEEYLDMANDGRFSIVSVRAIAEDDIPRYVPMHNCIYNGQVSGHSSPYCTADSCY